MNEVYRDLLAEGSAGAHDGRRRSRCCNERADRDRGGGRARRRRTRRRPPERLDDVAESVQLRHQVRQHAVPRPAWSAGTARTTPPIKGDIAAQTKTVLDNGAAMLKAAGMSFADVVSVADLPHRRHAFQDMNTAYRTYFPTDPAGARDGQGRPDRRPTTSSRSRWSR